MKHVSAFKMNLVVTLCAILFSSTSWATTYYVSSSTGNDSNNGTATSAPWKTISKVNSVKFQPGDQVLFLRGDVWRETLNPGSSGSSSASIFYGAYGTGNKPSLRGSNSYNAISNWTLEGGNLWYLSSIANDPGVFAHDGTLGARVLQKSLLVNQWNYWYDSTNQRVYVYSTSNPATLSANLEVAVRQYVIGAQWASYTTYDNLDIRHAYSIGWLGWGGTYVKFTNCNFTQSGGDHLLYHNGSNFGVVANCSFSDWGARSGQFYAVHTQGTSTVATGPVDVSDCQFSATGAILQPSGTEHTVMMQDSNSWIRNVQRNQIDGSNIKDDGIVIWDSSGNATSHLVESNTVKNIGGIAITIQQLESHGGHPAVTVRYNKVQNVSLTDTLDKAAVRLRSFSSASPVSVYYNVVNTTQQGANSNPGIDISGASGAKIYNNTIYGVDNGITVRNSSTGTSVVNNVLFGNRDYGIQVDSTSTASGDYNCINGNSAGGYSGTAPGAHDIASNPLLVAPAQGNLRLTSTSPCKDRGANLGLTKDTDNDTVPYGTGTDIGAYEYIGSIISPPSILGIN